VIYASFLEDFALGLKSMLGIEMTQIRLGVHLKLSVATIFCHPDHEFDELVTVVLATPLAADSDTFELGKIPQPTDTPCRHGLPV
jgi:hypothetical protein